MHNFFTLILCKYTKVRQRRIFLRKSIDNYVIECYNIITVRGTKESPERKNERGNYYGNQSNSVR